MCFAIGQIQKMKWKFQKSPMFVDWERDKYMDCMHILSVIINSFVRSEGHFPSGPIQIFIHLTFSLITE